MQEVREEEGITDAAEERLRDQEKRRVLEEEMAQLIRRPLNVTTGRLVLVEGAVEDVEDVDAVKVEAEAANSTDIAEHTVTRKRKFTRAGVATKAPPSSKTRPGALQMPQPKPPPHPQLQTTLGMHPHQEQLMLGTRQSRPTTHGMHPQKRRAPKGRREKRERAISLARRRKRTTR